MYEVKLLDVDRVNVSLQDEESLSVEVQDIVGGGGSMFAVTYTPQELTEEEKHQARENIDALGNNELSSAIDEALLIAKESGAFKGETGAQGAKGADGTSATHRWSGTTLYVTSASGTSSANLKGDTGAAGKDGLPGADGKNGEDGYTPRRGTDYWTDADKAEIKSYVDEAILGGAW